MAEKVLIAPLHWGLGHAARCIPIVNKEIEQGNEVFISANGNQRALLQEHFPDVKYIDIPFMEITYPKKGNMTVHFAIIGPKLLLNIWREHKNLSKVIKRYSIDKVISDSRFGLWNKDIRSIFISHQIEIKTPRFQALINVLNRWILSQYNEVWIPDYETNPGLAGELSHPEKMPKNCKYIGPLSRFSERIIKMSETKWDALALISGPEPQRTMFENQLKCQFVANHKKALILKGTPNHKEKIEEENITTINHLTDRELMEAVATSKQIHSRSGYSTIMDFHVLGIDAIFYPTPGQTEQEYLWKLHQKR